MRIAFVLAAAMVVAAGCGDSGGERPDGRDEVAANQQVANGPASAVGPISFRRYDPVPDEKYANGKRLAAQIAQDVLTYPRGATPTAVAQQIAPPGADAQALSDAITPLVDPEMRSGAKVIYPQLSGVTATSLGAMVVVRQVLEDAKGRRRFETRVLDVRLRRQGGPWQFDRIGSIGGRPRARPYGLPAAATRVVDHRNITLSDSARWDIYSGQVDDALLDRLADLANRYPIAVSVLTAGHPRNVWKTDRPSAHAAGFAADIYAVGGRLVVRQPQADMPAYGLARAAISGGARQVGSPWNLGEGSITDDVHADHVHIQQRAFPGQSRESSEP